MCVKLNLELVPSFPRGWISSSLKHVVWIIIQYGSVLLKSNIFFCHVIDIFSNIDKEQQSNQLE